MKGWKSFLFGLALAVLGFMQQFDWATILPEYWKGLILAGVGAAIMWLRSITDTPLFKSK